MLSQSQRATILELHAKGTNKREIAKLLNLSRQSARKVLQTNSIAVPKIEREEKAAPHRQRILELLHSCKGNLVRVHEELIADGATLSYQALTAFCRRQGIGQNPIVPAGRYHFEPGVEMQHDTSPHEVIVAAHSTKRRPPPRCCATRACSTSRAGRGFNVSIARRFSPKRCATWAARHNAR